MLSHIMWIYVICIICILNGLMAICCKRLSATSVIAIYPLDYCLLNAEINYSGVNSLWPDGPKPLPESMFTWSLNVFCGIHLGAISQEVILSIFGHMYSEILLCKIIATSPRAYELTRCVLQLTESGIQLIKTPQQVFIWNRSASWDHLLQYCRLYMNWYWLCVKKHIGKIQTWEGYCYKTV